MKQVTFIFTVTLLVFSSAYAQNRAGVKGSAQGESQTKAQTTNQSAALETGAQLSAELLTTLDARKVKPGDEFKMRTLKPVFAGGKQVIGKGSVLTGHVMEAAQAESKKGVSQLKLSFDQLTNKNLTLPFSATIEQITQASVASQTQMGDLSATSETSGGSTTRTSTSRSGSGSAGSGGLVGGVTGAVGNTVGGVVGTTTETVNGTVNGVTSVAHQATGAVIATTSETLNNTAANAKGLIAISSESSAQASGNSTLSLTGKDVRIEKGAVFLLRTDKSLNLGANQTANK